MRNDEINTKIQDEKLRHQRVINDLETKKYKENQHHQRQIEYLKIQKTRLEKDSKKENLDIFTPRTKKIVEELLELIKKALED